MISYEWTYSQKFSPCALLTYATPGVRSPRTMSTQAYLPRQQNLPDQPRGKNKLMFRNFPLVDPIKQGQLYGGGTIQQSIPRQQTKPIYPQILMDNTGALCIARIPRSDTLMWIPTMPISIRRSTHHLDHILSAPILERIKWSCQQPQQNILVYSKKNKEIYITSTHLRQLMVNGQSINNEMMHLFLEVVCDTVHQPFLCPQFLPLLHRNGWNYTERFFYPNKTHPKRSIYKPGLREESAIAIPCYIHGCHWVALARREIRGNVVFLYSDDLNDNSTENTIKHHMRQTNKEFYPDDAEWINCISITHRPHHNECGPRTALALPIFMTHPFPHREMLLPFMHPNLSQILGTWVASVILSGEVYIPPSDSVLDQSNLSPRSEPASLAEWTPLPSNPSELSQIEASPAVIVHNPPAKATYYPIFQPNSSKNKQNAQVINLTGAPIQNPSPQISSVPQSTDSMNPSKSQTKETPSVDRRLDSDQPKLCTSNRKPPRYHKPAQSSTVAFDRSQPKISSFFTRTQQEQPLTSPLLSPSQSMSSSSRQVKKGTSKKNEPNTNIP
jgi:hypothetical protein